MSTKPLKFQVSSTVSPAAAAEMNTFFESLAEMPHSNPPKDVADFDKLAAEADQKKKPLSDKVAQELGMAVTQETLGGQSVLRIKPPNHNPDDPRVLIYTHGGGFVVFSAPVELVLPSLLATNLGVEIISVDYTLAPRGTYQSVPEQVLAVYKALLEEGQNPQQIGMFGDSVGGNITLATVLKLREQGLPLPGALLLVSPSTDISEAGDTRMTLDGSDPILARSMFPTISKAYAPDGDEQSPYASPVHGDYTQDFPPTLIQGGTREILLSDFVRVYQAMIQGGKDAVLDLYEGMCHVFQARFPDVPETQAAIRRAGDFFRAKLAGD